MKFIEVTDKERDVKLMINTFKITSFEKNIDQYNNENGTWIYMERNAIAVKESYEEIKIKLLPPLF